MITAFLHDQTEIRSIVMIVSHPIKDSGSISFKRGNYLSHEILILIIILVMSNNPGPALEGTGHMIRMCIFTPEFRNVEGNFWGCTGISSDLPGIPRC